jgi:hypothetical protein
MLSRTALITLAAALAATISASTAEAGMNNFHMSTRIGTSQTTPNIPDVKATPPRIHTDVKLMSCYHTREPNELGVYVHRTHCR